MAVWARLWTVSRISSFKLHHECLVADSADEQGPSDKAQRKNGNTEL